MRSSATLQARYITLDLTADKTDHKEWNRATTARLDHYWSGAEAPSGRWAEVGLLWSDRALLVRFVCTQTEALVVSSHPQTKTKTHGLWERDVCEVFIAPDPTHANRYFEFEAAPTGEWIDLAIELTHEGRQTDWAFESGMTTAAHLTPGQITIVIRIPWSDALPKPHRDDHWRVNLFRCVGAGENRGYLAWQPTRTKQPNFHRPEVFGRLIFI